MKAIQYARSILFQFLFYFTTTAMLVLWSPLLLMPRSWAMAAFRINARLEIFLLRVVAGVKLEVRGRENIVDGACLVASKHQSAFETFALMPQLRDPAYLMKKELFRIPFHGWFSYKFGMIPVARDQGAKALREMLKAAQTRAAAGREIIIFPEGTRRPVGAEPDYKTGVFLLYQALKLPCVPVALNSGVFWPRRTLLLRQGTVVFEFLPPIPAGLPRAEFLARLEETIESASNRLAAEARSQLAPF
ncbi:1-acyl-sn-glycerol-3-phosphate acyltransferase [Methyloligella halotolerans]|uniref:1-acyl-sn-glycerol-3-phosphate acyltransferase n=1 Tax=Methyloligella halotolerans TaxID=1177755 RepID=A0A1E2RVS4_9HYPH|nr:lysophospholipid acyltransferase family protein [Methyloligella halotolerans]ODA66262.1 1-acyl-sn-glycerol-3-phosphate acyltransferase [Methyloligella halotolerans]